jgi:hypothetical protein
VVVVVVVVVVGEGVGVVVGVEDGRKKTRKTITARIAKSTILRIRRCRC